MTTLRRTSTEESLKRADAVRARRKQKETQKTWTAARTVSHTRAAHERTSSAPSWKRRGAAGRTRRWNAMAPTMGGLSSILALTDAFPILRGWRLMSLTMVMLLGSLLFHLLTSPAYFIDSINLSGSRFIPGEEIYDASGVHRQNILWLDPERIQASLDAVPGVKDAYVEVQWPNQVYIAVVENEPALAWSQGGQTMWVDREGVAFPQRGELPGLLPIVADDANYPLTKESRIPVEAIAGALQLKQLRSNIELLHYDPVNGISYQDGRNWRGYFGVGTDMDVKLVVYETLIENLLSRGIHPSVVSVVNEDAPYYRR